MGKKKQNKKKTAKKEKLASTSGKSTVHQERQQQGPTPANLHRASAVQEYKEHTDHFLGSLEKHTAAGTPTSTSFHDGSIIKAIQESVSFLCQREPAFPNQDEILGSLIPSLRDAIHGRCAVSAMYYQPSHHRYATHQYFNECLQSQLVLLEQRATPLLIQPSSIGNKEDTNDVSSEEDEDSSKVPSHGSSESTKPVETNAARAAWSSNLRAACRPALSVPDDATLQHLLTMAVVVGDGDFVVDVLQRCRPSKQWRLPHFISAMELACFLGRIHVVDALVQAGCPIEGSHYDGDVPLFLAATAGQIQLVEHLIKVHKANVNISCGLRTGLDIPGFTIMRDMPVLCHVAQQGNLPMLECLLKCGANVNERCARVGAIALHYAVFAVESTAVLNLLIQAGATINLQARTGWTALHSAADNGHVEAARCLLRHKADMSIRSDHGDWPIHGACEGGHLGVVKVLVDAGCNIDVLDGNHYSPLILAVRHKHVALAMELVQMGANVNLPDKVGPVLHKVLRFQQYELVPRLLEHGADVNAQESDGESPLHALCRHKDSPLYILDLLMKHGANPNARMIAEGPTPVLWAHSNGNMALAKGLYHHGADMFVTCKESALPPFVHLFVSLNWGSEQCHSYYNDVCRKDDVARFRSLLRFQDWLRRFSLQISDICSVAVLSNSLKIITEIVGRGFDIDTRFADGYTMLTIATSNDHTLESFRLLLEKGADPNVRDGDGWAPLHLASINGRTALIAPLIKAGADVDAKVKDGKATPCCSIHLACRQGHLETVKVLLDCGCGVDSLDQNGNTPLPYAICEGHIGVAWELIDRSANVNAPQFLSPVLCLALRNRHCELIPLLLERGADVNARDAEGLTPLHALCWKNAPASIVDELVMLGADVNAQRKKDGMTPLHLACYFQNDDIVERLLNHQADWFIQDEQGIPPFLLQRVVKREGEEHFDSGYSLSIYIDDVCQRDDSDRFRNIFRFFSQDDCPIMASDACSIMALAWKNAIYQESTNIIRSMVGEQQFQIGKIVLEAGASLLHYASASGASVVVDLLLALGADVNQPDDDGCTSLHAAARYGHVQVLHRLLKAPGANANAISFQNDCPSVLCEAIQSKQIPAIQCLVNSGARIDRFTLVYAKAHGTMEIFRYLTTAPRTTLAASRSLQTKRVYSNHGDERCTNPLGYAAIQNHCSPQAEVTKRTRLGPDNTLMARPKDWLMHATIVGAALCIFICWPRGERQASLVHRQ
jgi:ankyrin repeat protein